VDGEQNAQKFRIPERKNLLEDVCIDGSIILKLIVKQVVVVWTRFNCLRLGSRGSFFS